MSLADFLAKAKAQADKKSTKRDRLKAIAAELREALKSENEDALTDALDSFVTVHSDPSED